MHRGYVGRFAPSPTGLLHAGSLVAALASYLDAKAHQGRWLVRIEDVDTPRCVPGAAQTILEQLAACGMRADAPAVHQSQRTALYQAALQQLVSQGDAYPCACSRKDIEMAQQARGLAKSRHGELLYPGTCRAGLHGRAARAWRIDVEPSLEKSAVAPLDTAHNAPINVANSSTTIHWNDRRLGPQTQDLPAQVGDFVLLRADGLFAYQLAVVVDDAAQGVSHIVRGEDLADNTARQIYLQQRLRLPTPSYLHAPLVLGRNGEKLSKQNGALAIDTSTPSQARTCLDAAAAVLLLPECTAKETGQALHVWAEAWKQQYCAQANAVPRRA
ncbi:tRNA glutamyl-Q(34) synthetase GluQRS [Rhodoferax aquaticus]|uniref:Glutamyl-Q tRNA(Asp) synthetase n=1 Tax=Rhodoferax aquaticus TaxID=2527691 RepID=A0A515EP96_9BURK|nr:tRNA glutamyl-Q(34) synthetase GluQRS [Rhodoferax aquaticus]QDL54493.1 tRNA glutamyl-Q(34) synthetase GluQRS [Rhodoferax aquaticus]